jgi:hypothetical protein
VPEALVTGRKRDPELASYVRIEERELEAGAYLWRSYADPLMAPGAFRGYGG